MLFTHYEFSLILLVIASIYQICYTTYCYIKRRNAFKLLDKYKVWIEHYYYPDKSPAQLRSAAEKEESWRTLIHVYGMIERIQNEKVWFNDRKLNRWIGYIQCILLLNGVVNKQDLRKDSKDL
ncbi:MAG: hypothetical protein WC967_13105 [Balneolaceae bacterium]